MPKPWLVAAAPRLTLASQPDTHPGAIADYLRVRETLTMCERPPLVPMICRVYVPVGERREVDTCNVVLVLPAGFGVKEAVTLLGKPVTAKTTDPANPLSRVIETV